MFSRLGPFSRFIARRFARGRVVRRRFRHEALETRLALAVDPVAVDDPVVTFVGEPLQIDVTANDLVSDTGEPFDPTTVELMSVPLHGDIAVDPITGVITYTPGAFYSGPDTFTYRVRDTSTGGTTTEEIELIHPAGPLGAGGTPGTPGSIWKYLDNGSDQGVAWSAPNFDDSLWPSGPSQLGYGDGDENTVVNCGPSAPLCNGGNNLITTYFRHKFTVDDLPSIVGAEIGVKRDDGVTIYLNDEIVGVSNMLGNERFDQPATAQAATAVEEQALLTRDLDAEDLALLVAGENTIAAEVHQVAPQSSDVTFDFRLIIERSVPGGRLTNTGTVTIDVRDARPTANTDSAQTQQGQPVLIDVLANDAIGAAGDPLNASSVEIVSQPAHGTAQVDPQSGAVTYTSEGGFNGADTFSYRVRDTAAQTGFADTLLLPRGSNWKYLDTGVNPGATWMQPAFNDSVWLSGPAELGYGDGGEATVIRCDPNPADGCVETPTPASDNFITTYFRGTFEVEDPSAFDRLAVLLRRDDGAIVYINGREVVRQEMPIGAVTATTRAAPTDFDDGTRYFHSPVSGAALAGLLVAGQNTIAVEVHQDSSNSSDVSFDLELFGQKQIGAGRVSNIATVDVTVSPVTSTECTQADLSGDGQITTADFGRLVRNYGAVSVAAGTNGDLDSNGRLGLNDLRLMQALMGQVCAGGSPAAAPSAAIAEVAAAQPRRARVALRALAAPAVDRAIAAADDSASVRREQSDSSPDSAASSTRLRARRQSGPNRTTRFVGL